MYKNRIMSETFLQIYRKKKYFCPFSQIQEVHIKQLIQLDIPQVGNSAILLNRYFI